MQANFTRQAVTSALLHNTTTWGSRECFILGTGSVELNILITRSMLLVGGRLSHLSEMRYNSETKCKVDPALAPCNSDTCASGEVIGFSICGINISYSVSRRNLLMSYRSA